MKNLVPQISLVYLIVGTTPGTWDEPTQTRELYAERPQLEIKPTAINFVHIHGIYIYMYTCK